MLDRLDTMRLLVRVIERRGFTAAAADLSIPRSTATEAIRRLEERLGTRLLERTTRHVAPTLDGEAYYRRCLAILADIEDAEGAFMGAQPRGRLRVEAHGLLTRTFVLPRLREFLARYPLIDLHIGQSDRLVDIVREGLDCVIRAGEPSESGMIIRRIASIEEITCASPAYLADRGVPVSPDALDEHHAIGFVSSRSGEVMPLEFMVDGRLRLVRLPSSITTNNSDTVADLVRMGFGLAQAPRYRFAKDLADGTLIEVLPAHPPSPTPLTLLYPQNRQLAPRVRVFLDWVTELFGRARL